MKLALAVLGLCLAGCGSRSLETIPQSGDDEPPAKVCSCALTDYYADRWRECEATKYPEPVDVPND